MHIKRSINTVRQNESCPESVSVCVRHLRLQRCDAIEVVAGGYAEHGVRSPVSHSSSNVGGRSGMQWTHDHDVVSHSEWRWYFEKDEERMKQRKTIIRWTITDHMTMPTIRITTSLSSEKNSHMTRERSPIIPMIVPNVIQKISTPAPQVN